MQQQQQQQQYPSHLGSTHCILPRAPFMYTLRSGSHLQQQQQQQQQQSSNGGGGKRHTYGASSACAACKQRTMLDA
jgi:hypothetical protein